MPRSIAIIGGGVIGTCTAYYLSRHPKIGPDTVIRIFEGTAIAAASSGKAGGFLSKDWHRPPTVALGALSFDLHEQLAKEHDGVSKWGYRRVSTLSVNIHHTKVRRDKSAPDADWLNSVSEVKTIGSPETTAQVHPRLFTQTMAQLAEASGLVEIVIANVEGLEENEDGTYNVIAIKSDKGKEDETISFTATDVVFAAGPWTGHLAKRLLGDKAGAAASIVPSSCTTSVVIRPSKPISAHCIFTSLTLGMGHHASPEMYPRPDGTIYVCGEDQDVDSEEDNIHPPGQPPRTPIEADSERASWDPDAPLPKFARQVEHSPSIARYLVKLAGFVSPSHLAAGKPHGVDQGEENVVKVEAEQACYRPDSSRTGAPIIGQLDKKGLWLASGHQVWGITNGPGTGKLLAELMIDGKATSADIKALYPDRI